MWTRVAPSYSELTEAADTRPHAVVIGAGFGGLAAAIRLSARGYRVSVLERLEQAGGRASVFKQDGFTFDAGPTIITLPALLDELWALHGRRFADDVTLKSLTPFYKLIFDDGSHFECSSDEAAMRAEIMRLSPGDLPGYERFMSETEAIYNFAFEDLGQRHFSNFSEMLTALPGFIKHRADCTIYQYAAKHFKDERLRIAFSFHPLFIGGSPLRVTKLYALVSFLERKHGVHFAMGGTGAIVSAMVKLLERVGGRLRLNTGVKEIITADGAAKGVVLESGERLDADIVVSNADALTTYSRLLPASAGRKRWTDSKIKRTAFSMSLFVWYFGTKRRYEGVDHHTILLGPRYGGLLKDIFARKVLAEDFSLYIHRPTATDPSLAPSGCDTFYALSPVPHLESGVDWEREAEPYRQRIEKRLSQTILPGLRGEIVTSKLFTPLDFRDRLHSIHGAAFSTEPLMFQSAWFRAHNRSEELKNLFLVGAGTHPGAGVPGVIMSARILDSWCPMPPHAPDTDPVLSEAYGQCAALIRQGSKTFHAASRLLPEDVKRPAFALYAFCRLSDDAVDMEAGPLERRRAAVEKLKARLDLAYAGRPAGHAADIAFADMVRRHAMPKALPLALIDGLAFDAEGGRCRTLSDLYAYSARVAGSVGAMMTVLMGVRDPRILARATDLGVAMQLTNIARDVGEDARNGRLYLPLDWLEEAGIDPVAFLARPEFDARIGALVQRLLGHAEMLYRRSAVGIAGLPMVCRPAMHAARIIYREIGRKLAGQGHDSIRQRAVVGDLRKWLLLAGALCRTPCRAALSLQVRWRRTPFWSMPSPTPPRPGGGHAIPSNGFPSWSI